MFAQAPLVPTSPATTARPPIPSRAKFLETPGQIITAGDFITVRLERCARSPVLRKAGMPDTTTVPWWGNGTLRYEFT